MAKGANEKRCFNVIVSCKRPIYVFVMTLCLWHVFTRTTIRVLVKIMLYIYIYNIILTETWIVVGVKTCHKHKFITNT